MEAGWLASFPVSTLYESLVFLAAVFAAFSFFLRKKFRSPRFLALLYFGAAALVLALPLLSIDRGAVLFQPSLKSGWLAAHVLLSFAAYAMFALAAALGMRILARPGLEGEVEECAAIRLLLGNGLLVFTVGGIIFGAVWAEHSWGRFWAWDPKETWAFVTWCAYAVILHADRGGRLSAKKLSLAATAGFVLVLFTYVGVNLLFTGLHSYAVLGEP